MAAKAKIFKNGGSQAIRLPKECRFPDGQTEVIARRSGRKVILEPVDHDWSPEFLKSLGSLREDEEIPRLPQRPLSALKDPFE